MSQIDNTQTSGDLPLISIYMPTKNRLALLKRAINSVFAQTYPNIDIHIVNDGSTDGTKGYLNELAQRHDNVYVVHNETSIGACAARNIAINNAKGEFITGLDDDDEFLPERLIRLHAAYNDNYAFVCSSMYWDYGKKKRLIDAKQGIITLAHQLSYNEATTQVLVKRERVIAVGGFDENFVACQDYDLWTRLIITYGPAYRIGHASYIVNDTATTERMIGDPKSVKGYDQYFDKHAHLMTSINKCNQAFMRLRRLRQPMPLKMLIKQVGSGHMQAKIRYYLSSNFQFIKRVHRWLYK
ncbi:glycosyltransferase [Thalassotalea sp. G2M2-11]|uniref:glycosyltransferase family 2 protein n=1 Tax=Thalassotalea sp. G2M2-11 TaxID=2787627 RepID=UPI0019D28B41|nr:glycosyltransferase [Thalassotalea sp. G2M2-11]